MDRTTGTVRYAQHRDEEIALTVEQFDPTTGAYVPWDLSAATLKVRFRAYRRPPGSVAAAAPDVDVELSKVSGGSGGRVRGFARFATARPLVECEVVVVDESVTNTGNSPSGFRETQVKVWDARVEAALLA